MKPLKPVSGWKVKGHSRYCPCWRCSMGGLYATCLGGTILQVTRRLEQAQTILDVDDIEDTNEFLKNCNLGYVVWDIPGVGLEICVEHKIKEYDLFRRMDERWGEYLSSDSLEPLGDEELKRLKANIKKYLGDQEKSS